MMTKEEAIAILKGIVKRCEDDPRHYDDEEIEAAWDEVPKWYS